MSGPVRGELRRFRYRRDAEDAVRAHYNAALMAYIQQRHVRRSVVAP